MDLSKAFDCLPHDILICKLSTYGLSDYATKLLLSYLSNRKQQIKIGNIVSTWENIQKDVPQGSILGGPLTICILKYHVANSRMPLTNPLKSLISTHCNLKPASNLLIVLKE
jgi:hypothetical protein